MNIRVINRAAIAVMVCLFVANSVELRADVASWSAPNLDSWTYPVAGDPGGGVFGPTFLSEPGLDEFDQFFPQSGRDPMRRGMTFTGFETSSSITPSLLPSRYLVHSVTVTFRMGETALAGSILYDDTPETNAELLEDYVTGNIDTARPMEMYGTGFQAGFTGFDFATDPGVKPFDESLYPYQDPNPGSPTPSTGDDVLAVYPLGSDSLGNYVDVSNSLTGGYSATAPGNTTAPFEPTPWAIGTIEGFSPGDVIPDDQTFSFSFDLELPGVHEYMQQGLSDGALGFYLTSQHFAGDFHSGNGIPYPRWYTKEYPTNLGGEAPTLTVDYDILNPGDMDGDGDVDHDDAPLFVLALTDRASYQALHPSIDVLFVGDINGDLLFNLGDIGAFKGLFSTATGSASSVPEPSTAMLVGLALIALITRTGQRRR